MFSVNKCENIEVATAFLGVLELSKLKQVDIEQQYSFSDIKSQQLFVSYGNVIIELHMTDGRCVQLQSAMTDVYQFLDHAFISWLLQTGRNKEDCSFYDPDNSCWFPPAEE